MKFIANKLESPLKKLFTSLMGLLAQYKNRKKLLKITCLNEDFGVPAERHFCTTSHGKSACDGAGGTLKRLAAKASLQRPYNDQIMTPHQLYEWVQSSIHNLNFDLGQKMNTKKKRVCYQVDLQQLKFYVEVRSSRHLCRLRKAY
jgi:hypothetical protein